MYLVWLIVKNEIMFIVIANVEFDDFVAKIKEHGPDAWLADRTNTTVPIWLVWSVPSPAIEQGDDETETCALESMKVLLKPSVAVRETGWC